MNQLNAVLVVQQHSQTRSVLEESIAERRAYYKAQELLIAQQAEEGNKLLLSLQYAIREAEYVLRDLKTKCRNERDNLRMLEIDIQTARNDFLREIAEHEKRLV